MNSWEGAEKRLIALSQGSNKVSAAEEWRHDGLCQNFEQSIACCELSGERKLRFLYLIQNTVTGNKCWVGDKCLLQLRIPVFSRGGRVPVYRVREHLVEQMQSLVTNEALARCTLRAIENNDSALAESIIAWRSNGQVSLFEASLIFNAIEQSRMLTSDVMLPIFLRRNEDVNQLKAIPTWSLWRFWHCLTPEQVQLAQLCGHKPPDAQHGDIVRYQRETDPKTPSKLGRIE